MNTENRIKLVGGIHKTLYGKIVDSSVKYRKIF